MSPQRDYNMTWRYEIANGVNTGLQTLPQCVANATPWQTVWLQVLVS
jgi:hypothetical protein